MGGFRGNSILSLPALINNQENCSCGHISFQDAAYNDDPHNMAGCPDSNSLKSLLFEIYKIHKTLDLSEIEVWKYVILFLL